jgi:hypothetical protein
MTNIMKQHSETRRRQNMRENKVSAEELELKFCDKFNGQNMQELL